MLREKLFDYTNEALSLPHLDYPLKLAHELTLTRGELKYDSANSFSMSGGLNLWYTLCSVIEARAESFQSVMHIFAILKAERLIYSRIPTVYICIKIPLL